MAKDCLNAYPLPRVLSIPSAPFKDTVTAMLALEKSRIQALRRDLLAWFAAGARDLPWRRDRTIYGTWIAEIMLQQTTVAVVESYWRRFLASFPTVEDLARATEAQVLGHWEGLGYYSRARNLHRAAKAVAAAGGWPGDRDGWRRLPGVGPYTSAAVVSQALGLPEAAIDANARRVLTRWLVGNPEELSGLSPTLLEKLAAELLPPDQPGPWNEAVMELGALVCRARAARCADCPVLDHCAAGLAGRTAEIPAPRGPGRREAVRLAMLGVLHQGQVLLTPASGPALLGFTPGGPVLRDDFGTLHPGLWSLPTTPWYEAGKMNGRHQLQWLVEGFPSLAGTRLVGHFRHAITHYALQVEVHVLDIDESFLDGQPGEILGKSEDCLEENPSGCLIVQEPWPVDAARRGRQDRHPRSRLAEKALKVIGDNFS